MAFDFIIYNTTNTQSFVNNIANFAVPLIAAGGGAYIGSWLIQKNKLENDFKMDMQYLSYANSVLFAILNSLYTLKQQFVIAPEVVEEMNLLETARNNTLEIYLQKNDEKSIKEKYNQFTWLSKQIIQADYSFPINEEKMKILVDVNRNIFTLILGCKECLNTLNCIIKELNSHLHLVEIDMLKYLKPDSGFYQKWYELRNALNINVDDCIVNLDLLIKCLNKAGEILSVDNKKIKFQPIYVKPPDNKLLPNTQPMYHKLAEWVNG